MMDDAGQSGRSAGQRAKAPLSIPWGWLAAGASVVLLPLLFAVGMASWMTGGGASAHKWVPMAFANRGFIRITLITIGLAAALVAVCAWMGRIGAKARAQAKAKGRSRGEDGGVVIEFAVVLPFAVSLLLLLAQASFLMVGHLCVQYSAYCAARAAIVVIPDDLASYSGEAQNYVNPNTASSMKMNRIHRAAVWAVMPVSCSTEAQKPASQPELIQGLEGVFTSYGEATPGWVRKNIERKWQYAMDYTFVNLSPPISGDVYGKAEDVHVLVEHTFYLSVPVARTIFATLAGDDGVNLDIGIGEYGMIMRATCTLTNEGVQDYVDEESFP